MSENRDVLLKYYGFGRVEFVWASYERAENILNSYSDSGVGVCKASPVEVALLKAKASPSPEKNVLLKYSGMGLVEFVWASPEEAHRKVYGPSSDSGVAIDFASPEEAAIVSS
jgi:hypothetical protein